MLLAAIIVLSQSAALPAGYYSLEDIAAKLSAQGVAVRASPQVAPDLYALRLEGLSWVQIRDALLADGRLSLVDNNGLQFVRRPQDDNAEREMHAKYTSLAAEAIHTVVGPAAETASLIAQSPPEQRRAISDQFMGEAPRDPVAAKRHHLGYLIASGEMPFFAVAAPAALTAPGKQPQFSRVITTNLLQAAPQMFPSGSLKEFRLPLVDLSSMTDAELAQYAQSVAVYFKMPIDPATMATSWKFAALRQNQLVMAGMPSDLVPRFIDVKIKLADVQGPRRAEEHRARSVDAPTTAVDMPSGPLLFSSALLQWAERSKTNLVYHVPMFADFYLPPMPKASANDLVQRVNQGGLEQLELARGARERTGPDMQSRLSLATGSDKLLTIQHAGPVLIVRNELRLLDRFASAGHPGAPWMNAARTGEGPKLDDVMRHVARLPIGRWQTSLFPSSYLHFCNPLTFRPFAEFLAGAPEALKAVQEMPEGGQTTFDLSAQPAAARAALRRAFVELAPHNDAGYLWGPPPVVEFLFNPQYVAPERIEVRRTAEQVEFTFIKDDEPRLRSWVRNVSLK